MRQLIMLSSITYAMKARDYLMSLGIRAHLERTPRELGNLGCSYSLRVDGDKERLARMLSDAGIRVIGTAEI